MADDKALELRSITERFEHSTKVLDDLFERMTSLKATTDVLDMNSQTTQAATNAIRSAASELATMNGQLVSAVKSIRAAAEGIAHFMAQADTASIRASIADINNLLTSQFVRITAERDASAIELAGVRQELASARSELDSLRSKLAAVPEKTRRKLGL